VEPSLAPVLLALFTGYVLATVFDTFSWVTSLDLLLLDFNFWIIDADSVLRWSVANVYRSSFDLKFTSTVASSIQIFT